MTLAELNSLRPGDRVVYRVRDTETPGKVISIWRDDHVRIRWIDWDRSIDSIPINEQEAKYLERTT